MKGSTLICGVLAIAFSFWCGIVLAQTVAEGQAAPAPATNPFADWAPPKFVDPSESQKLVSPPVALSFSPNQQLQRGTLLNPSALYVYQEFDVKNQQVGATSEQTVLSVSGTQATIREVRSGGNTFTRKMNLAGHALLWSHSQGNYAYVKFPASVGDTWDWTGSEKTAEGGDLRLTLNMSAKFVGWEDVTVPAGSFKAAKIRHTGWWSRSDGPYSNRMEIDCWYSPEVGRIVKQVFVMYFYQGGGINIHQEITLRKYQPAPGISGTIAVLDKPAKEN